MHHLDARIPSGARTGSDELRRSSVMAETSQARAAGSTAAPGESRARQAERPKPPPLDPEQVREFVLRAHGDLDRVRTLLGEQPALVNAAWDWGGGDWETGLGAAAHMGRRDIALYLLERGARLDLFAAAMLGQLEVVKAILTAFPDMSQALGPHGIPLFSHAQAGGPEAAAVVEYLQLI